MVDMHVLANISCATRPPLQVVCHSRYRIVVHADCTGEWVIAYTGTMLAFIAGPVKLSDVPRTIRGGFCPIFGFRGYFILSTFSAYAHVEPRRSHFISAFITTGVAELRRGASIGVLYSISSTN